MQQVNFSIQRAPPQQPAADKEKAESPEQAREKHSMFPIVSSRTDQAFAEKESIYARCGA
jgi:hypothetical protein